MGCSEPLNPLWVTSDVLQLPALACSLWMKCRDRTWYTLETKDCIDITLIDETLTCSTSGRLLSTEELLNQQWVIISTASLYPKLSVCILFVLGPTFFDPLS